MPTNLFQSRSFKTEIIPRAHGIMGFTSRHLYQAPKRSLTFTNPAGEHLTHISRSRAVLQSAIKAARGFWRPFFLSKYRRLWHFTTTPYRSEVRLTSPTSEIVQRRRKMKWKCHHVVAVWVKRRSFTARRPLPPPDPDHLSPRDITNEIPLVQ